MIVLLRVVLGFLHGNGAAVHQLLHIGVVVGQLSQLTAPVQVGAGIPRVAQIGLAGTHQRADRGGAHTGQRLPVHRFLENETVGTDEGTL